jgi:hypothetical protein
VNKIGQNKLGPWIGLIPSACTTGVAAVAGGESNDEFIDVDRGDLRILGAFGLWRLPANFPYLPHTREVGSPAGAGHECTDQRRKLEQT